MQVSTETNPDYEVTGYKISGCVDAAKSLLAEINQHLKPADPALIGEQLTLTDAATSGRGADPTNVAYRHRAFIEGLMDFPEDVIMSAFARYRAVENWQPSVAELREYCWRDYKRRDLMAGALRRMINEADT
ncbi:MAG: hypothetical protein AAF141_05610 [Pseudomonadota bacterium]